MFSEKISFVTTFDGRVSKLVYDNARKKVKFDGDLFKQKKITYNHGPIVNNYIVSRLIPTTKNFSVTLENCPFGAVKLTKNTDIDNYTYSGYGIGFFSRGTFLHPSGGFGKTVIISGADMSNSVHVDNKKKDILILGDRPTQGLDNTTLTAEKCI